MSFIRVAVLPFKDLREMRKPSFLGEGISQDIINRLSLIDGFRITSSLSSFKFGTTNKSPSKISKALQVDLLIDGTYHQSKDKTRISASIIEPHFENILWSQTLEKPNAELFEVQDSLVQEIAEKIREHYWHFEILDLKGKNQNVEAYKLVLEGEHYYKKWNESDVNIAIDCFEKAIDLDSMNAQAYLGLANCFIFLSGTGYINSKEGLKKADDLCLLAKKHDPDLIALHFTIGSNYFWNNWNLEASFKEIQKVLTINPSHSESYAVMSLFYMLIEKPYLAQKNGNIALKLNPLSANTLFTRAWVYYLNKEYKNAIDHADKALELDGKLVPAIVIRSCSKLLLGEAVDMMADLDKYEKEHLDFSTRHGLMGLGGVFLKDQDLIEQQTGLLSADKSERSVAFLFLINAVSGNTTEAIQWLEKSIDERIPLLLFLMVDPLIEPIRNHPSYLESKKKLLAIRDFEDIIQTKKAKHPSKSWEKEAIEKLEHYMNEKQPFLEPNTSLKDIAMALKMHSNNLSWLINAHYGINFNEYINQFRVEIFKNRILDNSYGHLTLLGLAYECGFNSKSSFNTLFKRYTGLTPSQYNKQVKSFK